MQAYSSCSECHKSDIGILVICSVSGCPIDELHIFAVVIPDIALKKAVIKGYILRHMLCSKVVVAMIIIHIEGSVVPVAATLSSAYTAVFDIDIAADPVSAAISIGLDADTCAGLPSDCA